jgi:LDH2 family malate/lactate/ureidoglycolate dehydrogenase
MSVGATLITDPMHTKKPHGNDIGHCLIAIDPGLLGDREEFTADVTRLCNDLWATKRVDPAQSVMVAGDPQWNNAARRMREGIPVGPGLLTRSGKLPRPARRPGCWIEPAISPS